MKQSDDNKFIPMTSVTGGDKVEVVPDVCYYVNQIVNIIFIGRPGGDWVMVDSGMPKSAGRIRAAAEERFGENNPPKAIILTHGHFDHVGSIVDLVEDWKVPVYAHQDEFPFLTGQRAYPEPDPTVEGGGMLAKMSSIYPHEPVDIREVLQPLPMDNSVPNLPEWKWIHTPGHSPGHVAFFRDRDKTLLPGDAFVTVRQDSMYRVLIQKKEVNGPPNYLTTNWDAARDSVRKLEALQPQAAIPGHGPAMEGEELRSGLRRLAEQFDEIAVPEHGKYVHRDH